MIELTNVRLSYPQGATALENVSASLEAGSLHFLTGRSGAGKSSLLRLLYFALKPTAGAVRILGRDAARLSRADVATLRRRIGVVFQDYQLLDHLSVFENVALPLVVAGRRDRDYRSDVLEMLDWVKLTDKLDESPRRLSGGEKQRVAIARAMVTAPDLILADEPTGSVDPQMGERIMALFAEMHRLGRTVLIATHDLDLVMRTRAPRLHLERGRLIPPPPRPGAAAASEPEAAEPSEDRPEARAAFAALSRSLASVRRAGPADSGTRPRWTGDAEGRAEGAPRAAFGR